MGLELRLRARIQPMGRHHLRLRLGGERPLGKGAGGDRGVQGDGDGHGDVEGLREAGHGKVEGAVRRLHELRTDASAAAAA